MKISVVIHIKDSKNTIEQAVKSVKWADEIVIIDMESTDGSVEICKKYTDKIYAHKDVGYVEPARNFGISKANGDWILILDADEEITEDLATKLKELTTAEVDAWKLPRKNIIFSHWIKSAGWWPDYNIRFFKKGYVVWNEKIHSTPMVSGSVDSLPAEEKFAIIHHNYPSVNEFVSRLNNYTSITAGENPDEGKPAFVAFWHEFQRRFLAEKGYLDGSAGLHVSLLQSFYEAVTSIKQWEARKAPNLPVDVPQLLTQIQSELAYWRADFEVKRSKSPWRKFYWQVRRKLKK